MILGSEQNDRGEKEFILRLTAEERLDFLGGKTVKRDSGDSRGHFTVTVKLTRPKTKAARFRGL